MNYQPNRARSALGIVMAVALTACGGSGDSGSTGGGLTSGGGGGGSASCSLSFRQQFARDVIDDFYLFPNLVDTTVQAGNFQSVQGYINALVAPARAEDKDRFFTYVTSITEEEELIRTGSNAGIGIRLFYDDANSRLFVAEAFENAPGFEAGLDRGAEITSINNETVTSLFASGGAAAVSDALGPTEAGVTRTLQFRDPSGISREATITKREYNLDPVSDRYGVEILTDGARQVGYINLRTFIVSSAADQLRAAFAELNAQGITEVILDLRYNGGGLVRVAEVLGDLMAEGRTGQVFSKTILRESRSNLNSTELFGNEANAINVTKLAVISTDSTASASELVTNSFIPYLGNNMALIGSNSFGKPVGQEAFDLTNNGCDDRMRVVSFQTVNANDEGEYFSGLATVVPNTCRAEDDVTNAFGDPAEESIATALDFLAGRSCTAIAQEGVQGVASVRSRREALRPESPSAAQFEIPGLF